MSIDSVSAGALTPLNTAQASTPLAEATPVASSSTATAAGSQNIDATSQDFEAVFLSQMLSQMFTGDDVTSFFGGGTAGEVYKSYLMNEYGKLMAQSGGIGIASYVKQELLKLQEVRS